MLFWSFVILAVLVTPPVVVGLCLAVLYVYLRGKYPEFAARLLSDWKR